MMKKCQEGIVRFSINSYLKTGQYPTISFFLVGTDDIKGIEKNFGKSYLPLFAFHRRTLKMQCFPLYSILAAMGNLKVDYFSLDVEGADLPILKTIPWDKVNISVISVEANRIGDVFNAEEKELDDLMESNG